MQPPATDSVHSPATPSSAVGLPSPASLTTSAAAAASSALRTAAGLVTSSIASGVAARRAWRAANTAAAPLTAGVAMLVPDIHLVTVLGAADVALKKALRMCCPGANSVTHGPMLLKAARLSEALVAPTAIAPRAEAGLCWQASLAALPAEVTTVIPASTSAATASFTVSESGPPTDIERTDGAGRKAAACAATQARPDSTACVLPQPSHENTRTACSVAHLATPKLAPAATPAQCVPWPWQSSVLLAAPPLPHSGSAQKPLPTRPVNSACADTKPVSKTKTCAPAPHSAPGGSYDESRGKAAWSSRSRCHGGCGCGSSASRDPMRSYHSADGTGGGSGGTKIGAAAMVFSIGGGGRSDDADWSSGTASSAAVST